jgi:nucleoside-diphosphate-sugar epimerase
MSGERILIVGGQGPIGAWISRTLLEEGLDFLLLAPRPDNSVLAQVLEPEALPRLQRVFGDPRDPALIARMAAAHGITHILASPGEPAKAPPVDLRAVDIYGVGCTAGAGGAVTRAIRHSSLGRRPVVPGPSGLRLAYIEDIARTCIAAALGRLGAGGPFAPPTEEVDPRGFLRALEEALPENRVIAALQVLEGTEPILEDPIEEVPSAPSIPRTPLVIGIRRTAGLFRKMAEEGRLQEDPAGEGGSP